MSERRRVAILGGGAGSLTAAFELTATPALRERYEVTVHQLGWRLGGKGASGRRPVGDPERPAQRIEEHGLHVWFGFYENAFDVMRRAYEELDRPEGAALRTWQDAFHRTDEVVLLDDTTGAWRPMRFRFPRNDGVPGIPSTAPTLHHLLRDALHTLRRVEPPEGAPMLLKAFDTAVDGLLAALESFLGGDDGELDLGDVLEGVLRLTDPLLHLGGEDGREPVVCRLLRRLRDLVWHATKGDRYAMTFDLVATVFRGILRDGLDDRGFGAADDEELTAWLARHEAQPETLASSPILRAFYQLCFAYAEGDRDRPALAAGKALQAMLRMCLCYRGSIMWKMQAGMGDAIFAPLYEVLRARGVRFRFFSEVTGLGLSPDGALVDRVELREQARVRGDGEYAPLIADPGGLPCWPAAPRWEQLEDSDALRAAEVDFEAGGPTPAATARTLRRGEDFDDVVLGISIGSLPGICGELAARHERFATMLARVPTVATQALQVWLSPDPEQLGVDPPGMVSGAYVPPLDTLCDMTHLLPREGWPAGAGVRSIAYLCGTMPDVAGETQAEADARAYAGALEHLRRDALVLWPGAACGDRGHEGAGFDWSLLHDPEGREGEERLRAQYWRANVRGSERYVLTPPGSVAHRLRADESGCANLVLAGDWTRNGICGGSVEAAVTSGKLAARALSGSPAVVPGTDGWLEAG
ncbi:MAG TPA: NAD(P)-binding protein [Baekduia sp.]|nr:NAD(P)-binding protein [Baekduia sp.]